jgi:cytochrome d ubiquinol oxidase subunit I
MLAEHQPAALAAMEGLFQTSDGAPLIFMGQPDTESGKLDNPVGIPKLLSFLIGQRWTTQVRGLNEFPKDQWPDNIPLLFFSYHVMAGLGTLLILVMALCAFQLWRNKLFTSRPMLWLLMLAFPFPYIATTAGWMTAEVGRQPWLIYGLLRTADGTSPHVSSGSSMFSLLGFMGMYTVLGLLFVLLISWEINHGPEHPEGTAYPSPEATSETDLPSLAGMEK